MIKLRFDVDYPYPSRTKSFLYIALGLKGGKSKDYLQNARILAKMINESPREVKSYWFFTPYTIPDKRLLELLIPEKHEVALHIANKPIEEWKTLERKSNRTVKYYSIHGTKRLFARLLWGRKLSESQAKIPSDFPLTSFHSYITMSMDRVRYVKGLEQSLREAEEYIDHDVVLSLHPEWLFDRSEKNQRGPYYDMLKTVLKVDDELDSLSITKKSFLRMGRDIHEYEKSIQPTPAYIDKLVDRDVDVFTFLDRKWCCPIQNPSANWVGENDNVGLLEIKTYDEWWQKIGKKTRNMVRKAEKAGVKIAVVEPTDELAEGIWRIYNETPIRQGRAFPHYGESLELVRANMYAAKNNSFIAAYLDGELVGFIQILYGDNIAIISNILSLQKHWDKALNNALLAKAVEVCAGKGHRWLMYGRIGNHPTLDTFKENNGFVKCPITRYYIPLSGKGRLAIRLGLHRELKDSLPESLKNPLIPALNWVSRTKTKAKLLVNRH